MDSVYAAQPAYSWVWYTVQAPAPKIEPTPPATAPVSTPSTYATPPAHRGQHVNTSA